MDCIGNTYFLENSITDSNFESQLAQLGIKAVGGGDAIRQDGGRIEYIYYHGRGLRITLIIDNYRTPRERKVAIQRSTLEDIWNYGSF